MELWSCGAGFGQPSNKVNLDPGVERLYESDRSVQGFGAPKAGRSHFKNEL